MGTGEKPTMHQGLCHADLAEAADLLEVLLHAVDAGELRADSGAAVALVRRLEGALVTLREQAQRAGGRE